jgi:RNA polymerase sigma-70 factor (ECF subfamily)
MHENSSINESLLVQNLSKGNLNAFNYLYHEYSRSLYHFAYRYLKSEEEAEELVQEVFTIIWEKRNDLKKDLSFKSFLFTIAFNIIRKHFRTKVYLNKYLQSGIYSESDLQTLNNIDYNSLNRFIMDLVDQLPNRCKEIFVKSRVNGCSIKEISEELCISHKTVENQLTTALKFIRVKLNRDRPYSKKF